MIALRPALASILVLSLVACAPDAETKDRRESSPPLGFELAVADTAPVEAMPAAGIVELSVDDLQTKIAAGNVRLIDVRRDDEVASGMIAGAEHIPLDEFDETALDPDDEREIVLYCRSGRRSGIAAQRLSMHTGSAALHLAGGITAWREAGGPTTAD